MLALALLPTLSRALAHTADERSALAEICTPQGTKLLPGLTIGLKIGLSAAPEGTVEPAAPRAHFDHCPYCALGGATPLPAPLAAAALTLLPLTQAAPALFLHAPRTLFAWTAAQPRGPPARS